MFSVFFLFKFLHEIFTSRNVHVLITPVKSINAISGVYSIGPKCSVALLF